jgi:hypothetical protein
VLVKEKLNIEIKLCGHKGKIVHIWVAIADPVSSTMLNARKDTLSIYIDFDEPHPEGIAGMVIDIPAKEYNRRVTMEQIIDW